MANNNKYRHHHYNQPQVEVNGDKEVLQRSIDTLGLPDDTLELLKNNKFNTIFDIAKRTERDMFRVQTFNKKHLIAVKKAINAVGIDFLPFVPKEKQENSQNVEGAPKQNNAPAQAPEKKPFEKDKKPQQNNRPQGKPFEQDAKPQGKPVENVRPQQKTFDQNNRQQIRPQQNQPNTQNVQNNKQLPKNNQGGKPQQQNFERRPKVELPVEEWVKVTKNGKWGFSNGLKTVIEPRFDEVFCFKEGVACVDDGGKFGYIDTTGKYVIEPKFECAMSFSEGMAVFFEGEKCGYINKSGEVVLSAKYDAATAFENGRAKVKEFGKWSTIDPQGVTLWSK